MSAVNLEQSAKNIRKKILTAANAAGSNGAHVAPSLSLVEILSVLYLHVAKFDIDNAVWEGRDRIILSKGHGGLGYYAAMSEKGIISEEQFHSFEKNGGDLPGQPSKNSKLSIECSSGSLGMGLSYAVGLALSNECKKHDCNIYVILGDGELNEGSIWESAMFIGYHHLSNITAVIDKNSMQSDGDTEKVLTFDISAMWKACGWLVVECDGHNVSELVKAFALPCDNRPKAIIANTVKGKGVSFMENAKEWHHNKLSDKQLAMALAEIG